MKDFSFKIMSNVVSKKSKSNLQHKAAVKKPIYNDNCKSIISSEDDNVVVEEDPST